MATLVKQRINYQGCDRDGVGRGGSTAVYSVATFVEELYDRKWRELTVTNEDDVVIGEIGRELDRPSRRTWWAES